MQQILEMVIQSYGAMGMNAYFDSTGTAEALTRLLELAAAKPSTRGVMILAADANGITAPAIDPVLKSLSIPVIGGVFPQIVYEGAHYDRGTLVIAFEQEPLVRIMHGLSNPAIDYESWFDEHLPEECNETTMFVWVDGLSTRIGALIDALFNVMGLTVNYLGGGAGSLSFEQKPCLFSNQGLLEDAAILALIDVESSVGVKHGWSSVSGPYKVTESAGNVIKTLDWKPAFQVYQEVVEQNAGAAISQDNFFDLSKGHPFGIKRLDAENLVRDPIVAGDDGSLVCVGDVPPESFVDILQGSNDALISAAGEALQIAESGLDADRMRTTLLVDCISRVLYLEDDYYRELDMVNRAGVSMYGALTLGEIANNGNQYLEFYNKTIVVGLLAD